MPYYHVCITRKNAEERFEMDFSREKLQEHIVEPYHKGEEFLCEGARIDPFDIESIRISKTDMSFKQIKPIVEKQDDFSHIVGAEPYVVNLGENVTREFIKHPPRKEVKRTDKDSKSPSKDIFIVHGRDHEPMKELKTMLYEFGLNPIILHEQPSGSITLPEKLEKYSDVGYAFVILTPDDIGGPAEELEQALSLEIPFNQTIETRRVIAESFRKRARQNVILEFGYFMGLVGRDMVCCLHKGDVELPSDMHGIVYIPFKDSLEEARFKIMKELKAAGYEIKL